MNRNIQLLAVTSFIVLIASGLFFAFQIIDLGEEGSGSNNDLYWSDILNTTHIYDFTIYAVDAAGEIMDNWFPYNNTQLVVNITSIPELNTNMSAQWYLENIADTDKVQVSLANGSDIPYSLASSLGSIVSFNIFPVGDWDYFDTRFRNIFNLTYEGGQFPSFYKFKGTLVGNSIFRFNRNWTQQGSGHGSYRSNMYSDILIESGIPVYISFYYLFSHVAGFDYTITLTRSSSIS